MSIDNMFVRVRKVRTITDGEPKTNATGFFYLQDNYLYLITNRHVVVNEPTDHRPEALQIKLHTNAMDLRETQDLTIPLYVDDVPQWREHPGLGDKVDVVAVPINDPLVLSNHFVGAFTPEDIRGQNKPLPMGQEVLIVGFPLGFHDTVHHLPIVRSATIATSFSHPFKGEPYFLTDARMHRGTSGSPVIAKLMRHSDVLGEREPAWFLLGVHSSALDVSDRDPEQDERLGLNVAWYASLIPDIVGAPVLQSA
jgi:S1-C subfamily serine protease